MSEYDYFSKSVCLNEQGVIQAKAMGEHLKNRISHWQGSQQRFLQG
jgi:hypothetical protein